MRNPLAALVLSVSLAVAVAAQHNKSDREHDGLLGTVRSVRVETAKLEFHKGQVEEKKRVVTESSTYDSAGKLIERQDRDHESAGLETHNYRDDANGDRIESSHMTGMPAPVLSPSGKVIGIDGVIESKWILGYDKDGNRIEEAAYWRTGELWRKHTYVYDSRGHRTQMLHYDMDGLRYRRVYSYDSRDALIEMTESKPNGSVIKRESYSYEFDATGNWVKRITSEWNEKKSSFEPKVAAYRTITY